MEVVGGRGGGVGREWWMGLEVIYIIDCLLMDTYKTYNSANVHLGLVPAFYSMLPAILLSVRRTSLLERVVFIKFSTCLTMPISSDFVWSLFC